MSGVRVTVNDIDEVVAAIDNFLNPNPPDPSRRFIHDYVTYMVSTIDPSGDGYGVWDVHYQLTYLDIIVSLLALAGKSADEAFVQGKKVLQAAFLDTWGNADFPKYPVIADVRVKDAAGNFELNVENFIESFIDIRNYAQSANPAQRQALADWMWQTDQSIVHGLHTIKTAAAALKAKLIAGETAGPRPKPL